MEAILYNVIEFPSLKRELCSVSSKIYDWSMKLYWQTKNLKIKLHTTVLKVLLSYLGMSSILKYWEIEKTQKTVLYFHYLSNVSWNVSVAFFIKSVESSACFGGRASIFFSVRSISCSHIPSLAQISTKKMSPSDAPFFGGFFSQGPREGWPKKAVACVHCTHT